ncbi:hypothetical protein PRIPAC_77460 [Pristionchus pacificus]|uniref:C6 domain-containing protein n=1 Tax=Pristionchus pacificus TaxID=54126 RepID=A0A454XLC5_PRIPA|nr:hypothetical protein PRIPAC_77460 [Pristionchus pacificus]|eukprot:PDM78470.1 hypothetical protein PRIPAC_31049 [Pristionchus pacificus]
MRASTISLLVLSLLVAAEASMRDDSRPKCKSCTANLVTITTTGAGAKAMDWDEINENGKCAMRTFICMGRNANIEVNGGDGVIDDQGTGIVIFTVTCNEDGTAWGGAGTEVTQIECSAAE